MPEPRHPGLRKREEEYTLLRDAAKAGSTQARLRLDSAKRALDRQRAVRHLVGRARSAD